MTDALTVTGGPPASPRRACSARSAGRGSCSAPRRPRTPSASPRWPGSSRTPMPTPRPSRRPAIEESRRRGPPTTRSTPGSRRPTPRFASWRPTTGGRRRRRRASRRGWTRSWDWSRTSRAAPPPCPARIHLPTVSVRTVPRRDVGVDDLAAARGPRGARARRAGDPRPRPAARPAPASTRTTTSARTASRVVPSGSGHPARRSGRRIPPPRAGLGGGGRRVRRPWTRPSPGSATTRSSPGSTGSRVAPGGSSASRRLRVALAAIDRARRLTGGRFDAARRSGPWSGSASAARTCAPRGAMPPARRGAAAGGAVALPAGPARHGRDREGARAALGLRARDAARLPPRSRAAARGRRRPRRGRPPAGGRVPGRDRGPASRRTSPRPTRSSSSRSARARVATSSVRVRHWRAPDGAPVHHLVDPATGEPARSGLSRSRVAGPDPAWAEVWSKALFLAGRPGIARRGAGARASRPGGSTTAGASG